MRFYEDNLPMEDIENLREQGYYCYYTAEAMDYTDAMAFNDEIIVIKSDSLLTKYTTLVCDTDLSHYLKFRTDKYKKKFMLLSELEKMGERISIFI